MPERRRPMSGLALLAVLLAGAGAFVGCGGDEGTEAPSAESADTTSGEGAPGAESRADAPGPAERTDTITIEDFEFRPASAAVEAGAKVTFENDDTAAHTATSEDPGAFDTGDIQKGDKATVTLDEPGSYAYVCEFHPTMTAAITVR